MTPARSPLSAFLPEVERLTDAVSSEEGLALLGELERLRARLWLRLTAASMPAAQQPVEHREPDRLLSAEEAAQMLGVKERWLRDHAHEVPGRMQLPGKVTRFSRRKIERWIRERSA